MRWMSLFAALGGAVFLACASDSSHDLGGGQGPSSDTVVLFDASTAILEEWFHREIRNATEYRTRFVDGQIAVRAVGRKSASALVRWIDVDPGRSPRLEWMWRVDTLQPDADIRGRESDDVAASPFLVFGESVWSSGLPKIPTLRYVWMSDTVQRGAIIPNSYFPRTVRNVVVRIGDAETGQWVVEHRNITEDYRRAFGVPPDDEIRGIALFTDNDQTKQPVEAYYAWVRVHCSSEGG